MDEPIQHFEEWRDSIKAYVPPEWERLPELDLYMDQVITLMNKQLAPFCTDNDRLLTSSMINNYVKDEVLPRPNRKKYSRDHLAMLMMICILKSVLSLPEIRTTIEGVTSSRSCVELYPDFAAKQHDALQEVAARLDALPDYEDETLYRTAVGLALEASARRVVAARILDCLMEKQGEKKKGKDKPGKSDKAEKTEKTEEEDKTSASEESTI